MFRQVARNPARKPARVFTKGFTTENVKIFYDKLTSSGMMVHPLGFSVPVSPIRCFALHVPQGEDEPWRLSSSSTGTAIPLEVSLS